MQCKSCQVPTQLECASCGTAFCGKECSSTDPAHSSCIKAAQFLRYRDTNYISGTRHHFTLWKESHFVTDARGDVLFQLSPSESERVFKLLDLQKFHKHTEADRPQCCDIPYRVIEYGGRGDWVANMTEVPELSAALYQIYAQHIK
jgi:hypothetical protein